MKIINLIIISYLMMTNSCSIQQETSDFTLNLKYNLSEISKDSNGQNTSLKIENRIVNYSVKHDGADPRTNIKKEYQLSAESEKKLVNFIKKQKLNQNIKEQIEQVSPGINVSISMEIKIGDIISKSEIHGAVNAWGSAENIKDKITIKNRTYYNKVHSLLVFMKNDLQFDEIEI